MKLMNISPTGRQILPKKGTRNLVDDGDIKEAILSIERNQGFEKYTKQAEEVKSILKKLMFSLSNN